MPRIIEPKADYYAEMANRLREGWFRSRTGSLCRKYGTQTLLTVFRCKRSWRYGACVAFGDSPTFLPGRYPTEEAAKEAAIDYVVEKTLASRWTLRW